jgi:hypothetical protein
MNIHLVIPGTVWHGNQRALRARCLNSASRKHEKCLRILIFNLMFSRVTGGPFLCCDEKQKDQWFVVGTVRWAIKCAHPYLPGVYACVPKCYLD